MSGDRTDFFLWGRKNHEGKKKNTEMPGPAKSFLTHREKETIVRGGLGRSEIFGSFARHSMNVFIHGERT